VPTADFTRDNPKPAHIRIEPFVFAALCDAAVEASGAELLLHTMPAAVSLGDNGWTVDLCTKTGLARTNAKVIIDATGDANVVALAGYELIRPDVVQPATLSMKCGGYDRDALDYEALAKAAEKATANGELLATDVAWLDYNTRPLLRKYGHNANHIAAPGAHTSEGRTAAELEGRRAMLRMYRFFRRQRGLENFTIEWAFPEVGIRETVTIRGKTNITIEDYESGRQFADAVCYAFYPIDEHLNDGKGINARPLGAGVLPTIPRGALLPAASRALIVAGRCLASDREANSALRVQCPCMAMGQAAGAMAALAAKEGTDPQEVPMEALRAMLREHGAIVPEPAQVKT
jgi:hypothetical protein